MPSFGALKEFLRLYWILKVVAYLGIEPRTQRFSVVCSTN